MSKAKIMIVEDESVVAMDIKGTLTSLGYNVPAVAFSSEDAIKKAEEYLPDLVLMDIVLKSKMDGIDTATHISSKFNIPIVYLTAFADEQTLHRAKLTEPFGYLLKPFEERELVITIEMALYKHKMEKKLKESERWLSTTLKSIGDAVIATDNNGNILFMNHVAEKLTGWSFSEAINKPLERIFNIINENTKMKIDNPVKKVLSQGTIIGLANHTLLITKTGREIPIDDSAAPIMNDNGEIEGVVLVFRDITERKRNEAQLKYMGLHDSLTQLYNRTFFEEELRRIEKGRTESVGLILCDVDGLKLINDTLGHHVGDELLISAAKTIKRCFRDSDIVARVGGDEFAVLIPETTRENVSQACSRIREAIVKHNEEKPKIVLSISVGFSFCDNKTSSYAELFREADNAMYREKLLRTQSAHNTIVQALIKTQETRDYATAEHSYRLQELVEKLGLACNLAAQRIVDLKMLAQFHDIGKVGIPDRLLLKSDSLNGDETIQMQRHCEIGYRFALSVSGLAHIADWILKHHEWWNGEGYPFGLKGEEIPQECRILAIVDAYDTMISDRPYRKSMSKEQAIAELKKFSGIQFEPKIVDLFLKVLNTPDAPK